MGRVWAEEIRIAYDNLEYVRWWESSPKRRSEVNKRDLSSWTFSKVTSWLEIGHWIKDG